MSGPTPFKLAFVGGGKNSAVGYAHYVAAKMDGLWDLRTGAFSRYTDANAEAAAVYGVDRSRAYESFEELLQQEANEIDAVAILTPTPNHHSMVLQCLEYDVPVICEKALAMTSAQAIEIRDYWAKAGGFLAVIYNYSGYPMIRELRQLIRDNALGEILHFQAEMPQEGFLRTDGEGNKPTPQSWRQTDGSVPTLHLDLAVHLHELIHYLTNQTPVEVVADQSSRGWFPVVDNVICLAKYTNGVQGQFWFSKTSLGQRNGLRIRIYGSKGSAEWYQLSPEELIFASGDGRKQILDRASNTKIASLPRYNRFKAGHPAGFNEALANLYADIHAALSIYKLTGVQESDEVFGADLAVSGLQFLEAISRSNTSRQWESVRQ